MAKPTVAERFWAKVDQSDPSGCWPWRGARATRGYGQLRIGGRADGRTVGAHRVAYELLIGPIPEGLVIDHLCRNTSCVNPFHLEAVSQGTNISRGWRQRRRSQWKPS